VNADGSCRDIKVVRGVSLTIDREALRVMRKMPRWKPGRNNDQAVPVRLTLPISFKLKS
jgi:TonB family protein